MTDLGDWDHDDNEETSEAENETTTPKTPELFYGSVEQFVNKKLAHQYKRVVGTRSDSPFRWAPDWWNYPEAVSRLEALWRAWEHLRIDPATGMSIWWRRPRRPPHEHPAQPHRPIRRTQKRTTSRKRSRRTTAMHPSPRRMVPRPETRTAVTVLSRLLMVAGMRREASLLVCSPVFNRRNR